MQLSNNGEPLKLTWDVVLKQFDNLIKFAAKQQVENYGVDGMMSAEDLYQEGMIKLYDCWNIWCIDKNKDMDEFGPIFRKSLFRAMKKGTKKYTFVDVDDPAVSIEDDSNEDTAWRLYIEDGLQKLRSCLSPIAKDILNELADPSERTMFEVWADIERKKMLKSQGKRVNIPKDSTVRMKHIVRALGITSKQYDNAMVEIREKAPQVIER